MKWEDLRIMVALPCYGGMVADLFLQSWTRLLSWAHMRGVHMTLQVITNESLLPRARNMAVAKFLDQAHAFSHLLFIDADMGFRPETLERMIVWDKDLVGCPGPTKYIHWDHVVDAILHGRDPEVHTLRYAVNFHGLGDLTCIDGFAQVKDFGLCFCLMKKEAVLTMAESYPELKCPHMGWQDGRPFESENAFMFFDTMRDDKENRYLECDHAFLARWRKIGGEIWADMTSDLIHVGTHHYHGDMALYFMGKKWQDGRFTAQQTPWGRYPREPDVEVSSAEK